MDMELERVKPGMMMDWLTKGDNNGDVDSLKAGVVNTTKNPNMHVYTSVSSLKFYCYEGCVFYNLQVIQSTILFTANSI